MQQSKTYIGATVRPAIEQREANKRPDDTYTVYVKVILNRSQNRRYSIGISCTHEEYKDAINPLGRKTKRISSIQTSINNEVKRAEEICAELGRDFTFEKFRTKFSTNSRALGVYDLWEEIINEKAAAGQWGTAQSYRNALFTFRGMTREDQLRPGYEKKMLRKPFRRTLEWRDITPALIRQYDTWMTDQGCSRVTIGVYLRAFRVVINQALQRGHMKETPLGDPKHGKYRIPGPGGKKNTAISLQDIQAIASFPLVGKDAFYRDMFLVQFLMGGAYPMEVANLKWADIHKDEIRYFRVKTSKTAQNPKEIRIRVDEKLRQIIRAHSVRNSDYVFPILAGPIKNLDQWRIVKGTLTKGINNTIGKISKTLGMVHVSAKVARHSAATLYVQAGLNLQEIADQLGHQSTAITERYISSLTTSLPGKAADALKIN